MRKTWWIFEIDDDENWLADTHLWKERSCYSQLPHGQIMKVSSIYRNQTLGLWWNDSNAPISKTSMKISATSTVTWITPSYQCETLSWLVGRASGGQLAWTVTSGQGNFLAYTNIMDGNNHLFLFLIFQLCRSSTSPVEATYTCWWNVEYIFLSKNVSLWHCPISESLCTHSTYELILFVSYKRI